MTTIFSNPRPLHKSDLLICMYNPSSFLQQKVLPMPTLLLHYLAPTICFSSRYIDLSNHGIVLWLRLINFSPVKVALSSIVFWVQEWNVRNAAISIYLFLATLQLKKNWSRWSWSSCGLASWLLSKTSQWRREKMSPSTARLLANHCPPSSGKYLPWIWGPWYTVFVHWTPLSTFRW